MGFFKSIGKFFGKIAPIASILPGPIGKVVSIASSVLGGGKKKATVAPTKPKVAQTGGQMGILGTIAGVAKQALPALPGLAMGVAKAAGVSGRRRGRRKKSLTMEEMGKIMVLGQALGKHSPAVTLMTMKALSGRL